MNCYAFAIVFEPVNFNYVSTCLINFFGFYLCTLLLINLEAILPSSYFYWFFVFGVLFEKCNWSLLICIGLIAKLHHGHLAHADGNGDWVLTIFSALSFVSYLLIFYILIWSCRIRKNLWSWINFLASWCIVFLMLYLVSLTLLFWSLISRSIDEGHFPPSSRLFWILWKNINFLWWPLLLMPNFG